jgi:AAA family ATP:ADP antiporter
VSSRIGAALRRVVKVRDDEVTALLWSCAYCFAVLASFYVLRPLREEMGVAGGVKNLPRLFLGTLAAMLVASPLFSMLVSRYSRRRFIPYAYHFFTVNLLVFFALFHTLDGEARVFAARAFFVWTSVFNLFVVAVFWGYMADIFHSEQGKRLFGFIAAGGTVGAIAGSGLTTAVVGTVGTTQILLLGAVFVECAVFVFRRLDRLPLAAVEGGAGAEGAGVMAKTGAWGGLTLVVGSAYLLMICAYYLFFTTASTFTYLEQARLVAAASTSPEARTAIFARIDLLVNILSLALQAFMAGRIVRAIGVGPALVILPLVHLAGFASLVAWPVLNMCVAFQVLRRGTDYGIAKPAREVLYTVLEREEKYKAKSFIDTFVYRGGDALSASVIYPLVTAGGDPGERVLLAALPMIAVWIVVCLALGRRQRKQAEAQRVLEPARAGS